MDMDVKGKVSIPDGAVCGNIRIKGSGQCEGTLECKSLEIKGKFECPKDLDVKKNVEITGKAALQNIDCEKMFLKGSISAKNIKSNSVEILFSSYSSISQIQADKVRIQQFSENIEKNSSVLQGLFELFHINLNVEKIMNNRVEKPCRFISKKLEGDSIYIEHADIETLIGKNIEIGEDCHVENLYCKESYIVNKQSSVSNIYSDKD